MLECVGITGYAHRTARSGLHSYHRGLMSQEPLLLLAPYSEGFSEPMAYTCG